MSTAGEDPVVYNGDSPSLSDQEGSEGQEEKEEKGAAAGTGAAGTAAASGYDDDYDVMADEDGEHDPRAVGPRLSLEDQQVSCNSCVPKRP